MDLLVCVINKPELLDDVLAGLLEAGVTGCTVIESQGMARIITKDIPIFSGFSQLFSGAREGNYTIFSVIKDKELLDDAIRVIREVYGSFSEPSSGILFTLPIGHVEGLTSEGS